MTSGTKRRLVIPGWDVTINDPDVSSHLVARRRGQLTGYQLTHGAQVEVAARDEGELWILCDAQTRLAERLATAEEVAQSADAARARATVTSPEGGR